MEFCKTLVRIKDFDFESQIVYVIIPSWDSSLVIELWLGIIRKDLPQYWPKIGDELIANINHTFRKQDLVIKDFEFI